MSSNNLKSKKSIQPINIIIVLIVATVVIILGYFSSKISNNPQNTTNNVINKNTLYTSDAYSEEQVTKDKNTLDSIIESVNSYTPNNLTSSLGISAEVNKFRTTINDANMLASKYSTDSTFVNKINKMLNTIKQKQTSYFPIFRDSYCKVANKVMNKDSINSFISGNRNTILELIGNRYSDSTNIKVDFDILFPHLELLRYKQIIFRTKEENKIMKNYNINSVNDEIIK